MIDARYPTLPDLGNLPVFLFSRTDVVSCYFILAFPELCLFKWIRTGGGVPNHGKRLSLRFANDFLAEGYFGGCWGGKGQPMEKKPVVCRTLRKRGHTAKL